jgi:protein-S-isoprenylcysteine O-methyltransferase Ste14
MNPSPDNTRYLLLALLWLGWCCLHSALIAPGVTAYIQRRHQKLTRYYRLLYNAIAIITLIPVLGITAHLQADPFFRWNGLARLGQICMLLTALYLFWAGARNYDVLQFLGFRNLQTDDNCSLISEDCQLENKGILNIVRHPWYTGGILIIWTRNIDGTVLVTNTILTGYFIVGAWLEERKLVRQFGDTYRTYQQNVSMLFPTKWLRNKLFRESKNRTLL